MYGWIWNHLPGNAGARTVQSLLLVLGIAAVLWFVVFPVVEPMIGFDDGSMDGDIRVILEEGATTPR